MTDLSASDLAAKYAGRPIGLVSCISFEDRSLVVPEALSQSNVTRWFCIENMDIETDVSAYRQRAIELAKLMGVEIEFLNASKRHPMILADTMANIGLRLAGAPDGMAWIVDVSAMTHEMVLVVVAAADELIPEWNDVEFIYNVAGQYSDDEKADQKWVSRGILEVRSVVGYPGDWAPGDPVILVALPGFDMERVRRIVEEVEPDYLLVGIAHPTNDHHLWSYEKNRKISEDLLGTRRGRLFEYSALDPYAVINAVLKETNEISGNVLLAPLNSKISTVAIGALSRRMSNWQVCYAPAIIYNFRYATASKCFLSANLVDLNQHVEAAVAASAVNAS